MEDAATPLEQRRIETVSFIIIDFETVTPKGYPPEPIELGAMRLAPGLQIDPSFVVSSFIKPPEHAPLTIRDTQQTGIRWQHLRDQPPAEVRLAELEARISAQPCLLIAHNAHYEAAIVQRYAHACPHLAAMTWIDTVALAHHLAPGLTRYTLDTLAGHFALPIPASRHRALPDVELTVNVLLRLLETKAHASLSTVGNLIDLAGLKKRVHQQERPVQQGLFEQ